MSYLPHERRDRMQELKKELDMHIMMCDDVQDIMALASIMMVTSKDLFKYHIGVDGTIAVIYKVLEDLENE